MGYIRLKFAYGENMGGGGGGHCEKSTSGNIANLRFLGGRDSFEIRVGVFFSIVLISLGIGRIVRNTL